MEPRTVADVMTQGVVVLDERCTVAEAARRMSEEDIGDVLVGTEQSIEGIVTDRDIVVRAVATGRDMEETTIGDIASRNVVTVAMSDDIETALELMENHAIRRLPVTDGARTIGFVSLTDMVAGADIDETVEDIAEAQPNQ